MRFSTPITKPFTALAAGTLLCGAVMVSAPGHAATGTNAQTEGVVPTGKAGTSSSTRSLHPRHGGGAQTTGTSASGSSTKGAGNAGRMDPRSLSGGAATTAGNGAGGSGADQ